MKNCIAFTVICIILNGASGQDPPPFDTTTVGPITVPITTLAPVITTTTTLAPVTTEPASTTVTEAPTAAPTTVVPDTTTVTPTPSSTIAPLPPGPPQPIVGYWTVYDAATNVTCIVARFAAAFLVPYSRIDGLIGNGSVVVNPNATADGSCGEVFQTLNLTWSQVAEGMVAPYPNKLDITFVRNITNNMYYADDIILTSYTDSIYFPNASSPGSIVSTLFTPDVDFFPAHLNNSYACRSEQKLYMTQVNGLSEEKTYGSFTSMQIQAFRTAEDQTFGTSENCVGDSATSDIVPIAVGCALAALVIIVLIAYLVGRSRAASRQRGYQSV